MLENIFIALGISTIIYFVLKWAYNFIFEMGYSAAYEELYELAQEHGGEIKLRFEEEDEDEF